MHKIRVLINRLIITQYSICDLEYLTKSVFNPMKTLYWNVPRKCQKVLINDNLQISNFQISKIEISKFQNSTVVPSVVCKMVSHKVRNKKSVSVARVHKNLSIWPVNTSS